MNDTPNTTNPTVDVPVQPVQLTLEQLNAIRASNGEAPLAAEDLEEAGYVQDGYDNRPETATQH